MFNAFSRDRVLHTLIYISREFLFNTLLIQMNCVYQIFNAGRFSMIDMRICL